MNDEIGFRLKICRYRKGYSQEKLAEELNISRSKVSSWESGRRDMSITDAVILVNLLKVSLDNMFNPVVLSKDEFCQIAKRYFESKDISLEEKNNTLKEFYQYRTNCEVEELLSESK